MSGARRPLRVALAIATALAAVAGSSRLTVTGPSALYRVSVPG